jgi:putative PIN family toxin of toxin-antitoxin system
VERKRYPSHIRRVESLNDVAYNIIVLKLVIDTDVMFAAFESATGASRALLLAVLDGRAALLASTTLMIEYEAVLTRRENLVRSGLTIAEVTKALDDIAGLSIPVRFNYRWRPVAKDPDDDLVIETAANGYADVIVSFNKADLIAAATSFGIAVERPNQTLMRLRQ